MACADWIADAEGLSTMSSAMFYVCMFQLADQWTKGTSVDAYVKWLQSAYQAVTVEGKEGG